MYENDFAGASVEMLKRYKSNQQAIRQQIVVRCTIEELGGICHPHTVPIALPPLPEGRSDLTNTEIARYSLEQHMKTVDPKWKPKSTIAFPQP
jgi:hypothetical protein